MLNALYFSIFQPELSIFIDHFYLFVVFIQVNLLYNSKYLFDIIFFVFFVLTAFEKIRFLSKKGINLLIESFEQLEAVVITFNLLDQPAIIHYLFVGL